MATTAQQIAALEAELDNDLQSVKEGDTLVWYKRVQDMELALKILKRKQLEEDNTLTGKKSSRIALADFS